MGELLVNDHGKRRAGARRTALILALVAVAFYFGIIVLLGLQQP